MWPPTVRGGRNPNPAAIDGSAPVAEPPCITQWGLPTGPCGRPSAQCWLSPCKTGGQTWYLRSVAHRLQKACTECLHSSAFTGDVEEGHKQKGGLGQRQDGAQGAGAGQGVCTLHHWVDFTWAMGLSDGGAQQTAGSRGIPSVRRHGRDKTEPRCKASIIVHYSAASAAAAGMYCNSSTPVFPHKSLRKADSPLRRTTAPCSGSIADR